MAILYFGIDWCVVVSLRYMSNFYDIESNVTLDKHWVECVSYVCVSLLAHSHLWRVAFLSVCRCCSFASCECFVCIKLPENDALTYIKGWMKSSLLYSTANAFFSLRAKWPMRLSSNRIISSHLISYAWKCR